MRAHFYTLNSLVMYDENVQTKGIVVVGFIEQLSKLDLALQWNLAKMRSAFPIRFTGVHFCYKKTQSLQAISILMLAISKATRKRMRWHNGTCDGRKQRIDCLLFWYLNSCPLVPNFYRRPPRMHVLSSNIWDPSDESTIDS